MKMLYRIVRSRFAFGFPVLLFLVASVAQAQFTYTTNNGTITITRYTGPADSIFVPAAINGLPVTGIAQYAFSYGYYGWNLTHLTIPDTVTNISELALYDCGGLSTISVDPLNPAYSSADGVLFNHEQTVLVQYPGGRAGSYTVPASVTALGKWAFNWCLNLTEIALPASVTNIEVSAFTACASLANITVNAMNPVFSSLGGVLFNRDQTTLIYYPKNGNGSYTVPNSVTSIADEALEGHSRLGEITMGDSVTNIGRNAFYSCEILTNVVVGTGVSSISDGAFLGCRKLTTVSLGSGVASLGQGAFHLCDSLQSLVLPDSCTKIGSYVFAECSSLTNLVFGGSVNNIEQSALYRCNNLTTVEIPDSVRSIGASAFEYCSSLTNISLGTNISNIDMAAFRYCVNLADVTVPTAVTNIGDQAFAGCHALTSFMIPANAARLGDGAFSSCTGLTNVTIPASVTNIGNSAFAGCRSLATIFVDALNPVYSSLGGIVLNTNRTELILCPEGKSGTYIIPDTVTTIRSNAFRNCAELTSITMLENVVVVGDAAFSGCRKLTNVVIGKNVAVVGNGAFVDCTFSAVTIPASVTNFGASVFAYCYGLREVYWRGNSIAVPSSAFYNTGATIYYLPGTTGWSATFAWRPTALWKPLILTGDGNFGMRTNQFGFNISWSSGMNVAIDACTNLVNPVWTSLQTNTLDNDTLYFSDPEWTNYPARFYRVRWP